MITALPPAKPVTSPDVASTPAIVEGLLLQEPPASVSVTEPPAQTCVVPLIADGPGFTVTIVDIAQPVAKV